MSVQFPGRPSVPRESLHDPPTGRIGTLPLPPRFHALPRPACPVALPVFIDLLNTNLFTVEKPPQKSWIHTLESGRKTAGRLRGPRPFLECRWRPDSVVTVTFASIYIPCPILSQCCPSLSQPVPTCPNLLLYFFKKEKNKEKKNFQIFFCDHIRKVPGADPSFLGGHQHEMSVR